MRKLMSLPAFLSPAATAAAGEAPKALWERLPPPLPADSGHDLLRDLADREEIRDIIATYAHRVAQGVSCADLMTDDGAFIINYPGKPPHEVRGRQALDAFYGNLALHRGQSLPMIHNALIDIKGDEATGVLSIEVRTTQNGQSIIASGWYHDTYRREGGRWKFVTREATMFHSVPIQQGWATPAAK